jgi:hypothetical protein
MDVQATHVAGTDIEGAYAEGVYAEGVYAEGAYVERAYAANTGVECRFIYFWHQIRRKVHCTDLFPPFSVYRA